MLNQLRINQSCKLHFLEGATRNSWLILEKKMKQNNATHMIKALAHKTLERNASETFSAKLWINNATFTPKNSPQKLRPEKPYFGLETEQLQTLAADDWDEVKENPAMLEAMVETYLMLKGLDPQKPSAVYTKTVYCQNCGEIKTWASCSYDTVTCCQWCLVNNDLKWSNKKEKTLCV